MPAKMLDVAANDMTGKLAPVLRNKSISLSVGPVRAPKDTADLAVATATKHRPFPMT
jgi:hypothetical protein